MSYRIGQGYDVHRLVAGRPLVLGGERIPSEIGLEGFSDADVVLHALCDAMLGALAIGDIGRHFPPGDARWEGVDSMELVHRVRELVFAKEARVVNCDITVLAERPQLAPHVDAMRRRIATALDLDPDRVSVKATTQEGLGPIGRGEGIAALAVVLVQES